MEQDETMSRDEVVMSVINLFEILWNIRKDLPEGITSTVLENKLQTVTVQLETLIKSVFPLSSGRLMCGEKNGIYRMHDFL